MADETGTAETDGALLEAIDDQTDAFLAAAGAADPINQILDAAETEVGLDGEELVILAAASGSTDLPIAERDHGWDASAADKRVRTWAGATEAANAKYARAFFWHDPANPKDFGSYKLGFADVVNGRLTIIPKGVFAVAAAVNGARGGVDIPDSDAAGVKSRVRTIYGRMASQFNDESIKAPFQASADQEEPVADEITITLPDGSEVGVDGAVTITPNDDGTVTVAPVTRTAAMPALPGMQAPEGSLPGAGGDPAGDENGDLDARVSALEDQYNELGSQVSGILEFIQGQVDTQVAAALAETDAAGPALVASAIEAEGLDEAPELPAQAAAGDMVPCPTCDGKGKIMGGNRDCPDCGGSGDVTPEKAAKLKAAA